MPKEMFNSNNKKAGNGLGDNNAKSWDPKSVPDYNSRGPEKGLSGNVESGKRKGAGAKQ